jgi:hypothetical protein
MSARWTRESPDTLTVFHSHHSWSRYRVALIDAAGEMGIPVRVQHFQASDGSWSKEYIVPQGTAATIRNKALELTS